MGNLPLNCVLVKRHGVSEIGSHSLMMYKEKLRNISAVSIGSSLTFCKYIYINTHTIEVKCTFQSWWQCSRVSFYDGVTF